MTEPQRRIQIETEISYEAIIIDAVVEKTPSRSGVVRKICWNTGEEKNCPSCYLSGGCKSK
jgi:hypothetical protein